MHPQILSSKEYNNIAYEIRMEKKEDKPVEPPMEIRQWISVEEGLEQALEANNVTLMHYKIFVKETSVD